MARLGVITASHMAQIITPKTRKLSASADKYMHELLAGWLTGIPADAEGSRFMERGTELEQWAVDYYEFQRDVKVDRVGFCLRDDRRVGCSPDGLVGEDGGIEIKCPSAAQHVANLLDMTDAYFTQVQGCMYVTGRKWWDLISYNPILPASIVRIERDEEYIAALEPALAAFIAQYDAAKQRLLELGCVPAAALAPEFEASLQQKDQAA